MRHRLKLVGLLVGMLATVAVVTSESEASRGSRAAHARTAFGPVYNPALTPEFRDAGYHPLVYQQMMAQKALEEQRKALQKLQREQAKMLKQQEALRKAHEQHLQDQLELHRARVNFLGPTATHRRANRARDRSARRAAGLRTVEPKPQEAEQVAEEHGPAQNDGSTEIFSR